MALAITSPSDKNITVGAPIAIQWNASGGNSLGGAFPNYLTDTITWTNKGSSYVASASKTVHVSAGDGGISAIVNSPYIIGLFTYKITSSTTSRNVWLNSRDIILGVNFWAVNLNHNTNTVVIYYSDLLNISLPLSLPVDNTIVSVAVSIVSGKLHFVVSWGGADRLTYTGAVDYVVTQSAGKQFTALNYACTAEFDISGAFPAFPAEYSGQLKIGGVDSGSPVVNTSGAFGYSKATSDIEDTATYTMDVTNNGITVSDSMNFAVYSNLLISNPTSQTLILGDPITISASVQNAGLTTLDVKYDSVLNSNWGIVNDFGGTVPIPSNYIVGDTDIKKFGYSSLSIIQYGTGTTYSNQIGISKECTNSGTSITFEGWYHKGFHSDGDCLIFTLGTSNWYVRLNQSKYTTNGAMFVSSSGGVSFELPSNDRSTLRWVHYAITVDQSTQTVKLYTDGVLSYTKVMTGSFLVTTPTNWYVDLNVGSTFGNGTTGRGLRYDDITVTKGLKYTANFTAPTSSNIKDSNTLLLLKGDYYSYGSINTTFNLKKITNEIVDTQIKTDSTYTYIKANSDMTDDGTYFVEAINDGLSINSRAFTINPQDINQTSNYGEFAWIF